ncbi:XVIPCD domain-containing protein [Hydrogenophaga sp. A37]|uniref:XVIPCD domain-containing protein n=1 Tax=Hydrogenophaga sp. A37 TaxID=1945864 RepID=UPI0009877B01|nr:XVIPCD domain-containing protein [Hydrogenophaga sp. A37]OOG79686.1 hypothetical protein B0E41_22650 [Hydrogenophaga sp. A37]
MSIGSQQYADLARDAYRGHPTGSYSRSDARPETIGGIAYLIRAHADNPRTGYQGTIYQRVDTGEIVVAHRGTEFDREAYKDGVLADAGMVLSRSNLQADDAIALTRQALTMAASEATKDGLAPNPVTVTGHSLGGTLAQVSAHHFGLTGETFNAFGAASLDRRIPEGGHSMINHVMAGDMVSAGSPHFGQVRIHARAQEVDTLTAHGFDNQTHWSDPLRGHLPVHYATGTTPPRTIGAAVALGDSHRMHHFVDVDAQGRPDHSVLHDGQAQALAARNAVQIGEYRHDVRLKRGIITAVGRGLDGAIEDTVDRVRGPLAPGEPAQRDGSAAAPTSRQHSQLDLAPGQPASLDTLSPASRRLLADSREQVQRLATEHGLPWNQGLENTAWALARSAQEAGLSRITHLKADGNSVRFAQHDGQTLREGRIDAAAAANTPAGQSQQAMATQGPAEDRVAEAARGTARETEATARAV